MSNTLGKALSDAAKDVAPVEHEEGGATQTEEDKFAALPFDTSPLPSGGRGRAGRIFNIGAVALAVVTAIVVLVFWLGPVLGLQHFDRRRRRRDGHF